MKKLSFIICGLLSVLATYAAGFPKVTEQKLAGYFPLASSASVATICTDAHDFPVVDISARMLADDVERVTGLHPVVSHQLPKSCRGWHIGEEPSDRRAGEAPEFGRQLRQRQVGVVCRVDCRAPKDRGTAAARHRK